MITVKKNERTTRIAKQFKEKYIAAGWKVVDDPKAKPKSKEVELVKKKLNPSMAAKGRKRKPATDALKEAEAIVATELREAPQKEFTDGLIKQKKE